MLVVLELSGDSYYLCLFPPFLRLVMCDVIYVIRMCSIVVFLRFVFLIIHRIDSIRFMMCLNIMCLSCVRGICMCSISILVVVSVPCLLLL